MFALGRWCLLLLSKLAEKDLVAILALNLGLLLAHRIFVKELIGFLLQGLNVMIIEQLRPIQLPNQLLVDACIVRCTFVA